MSEQNVNTAHYRPLRKSIKDYRYRLSTVEMGSDTTRAYFWPAVNKRPTRLWLGYFLTRPNDIFFTWNWKIWDFKGKFSNAKPKPKMADPKETFYTSQRWPHYGNFHGNSNGKIGKQKLNCKLKCTDLIKFDWLEMDLNKSRLRILFKDTFF